ncbi:MAG: hypothetical protein KGL39_04000 [Patescibacteria group bacterium]|nr:hypothetical protein [Patescibacteria group bacterium]
MSSAKPHLEMTDERARLIRQWRTDEGYTRRGVAFMAHKMWGSEAKWEPASDLGVGKSLCEAAAKQLGDTEGWA